MSSSRGPPFLNNGDDEDTSDPPAIPSGRLAAQRDDGIGRTSTSQAMEGSPSESNLVHRRGTSSDARGNPRSHTPGSSQTSVDSQLKNTATGDDVEAQAPNQFIARKRTCSDFCRGWINQIDFHKWYEWTAYYIPILEWLPQYKCISSNYFELT